MKKTLIALAALAAVGSSFAQSAPTVTVYGKADVGIVSKTNDKAGSVDQGATVASGNYEGSRLGVKGGSDLSGGIKATYQLEMGADFSGYATPVTINRVATVGLTGGFGTVAMGLQWTPYDNAWGWDQMEYNGFSAAGKVFYQGGHGDNGSTGNGNAKNSISYTTPSVGGFDATLMLANNADKTVAAGGTTYFGLGANYAAGPLAVNFGYEQVATSVHNGVVGFTNADKTSAYILGASYNLGVASVGIGYEVANINGGGGTASGKDTGWTLSASIPVSASTKVDLGWATETTTSTVTPLDGKSTGFSAQVIYNWTKQMAIYGGFVQWNTTDVGTTVEYKQSKVGAGLRYNF